MRSDLSKNFKRRIILLLLSATVVLLALVGVIVANSTGGIISNRPAKISSLTPTIPAQTASASQTPIAQVSPLLFGTNLGLFNGNDQVITSSTTRDLMQKIHITIVRIPLRPHLSNTIEAQALQAVKSIGAIPLVTLSGMRDPNVLADDTRMISDTNQIFGNSLVYYEFGNEDDWNGLPITSYTQGWNTLIPQFKHLALNGKFIGPVSYQYSRDNLTTFLQGANPRPDAISWHEYTCSYKDPAATCLSAIDRWSAHISDARAVMQSILGTTLPIMITEWNYASDQSTQKNGLPFADGKYNNVSFMQAWTAKALNTLAANRVFASMQYSVTNTALPLIANDNTLTIQGTTFQDVYQSIVHQPTAAG